MARIEFSGQGQHIPLIALPPFGSDEDLPSTVLTFTENSAFSVSDYLSLGFTHFEVWCVGAAGGRGGDATTSFTYNTTGVQRPVPADVWGLYIEKVILNDLCRQMLAYWYFGGPPANWDTRERSYTALQYVTLHPTYGIGFPPWYEGTIRNLVEILNPNHLMTFYTLKQVIPWPSGEAMGGGGGGGGMHKVSGELADLPDQAAITVGKSGSDAGFGQSLRPYPWTPDLNEMPSMPFPYSFHPPGEENSSDPRLREWVKRIYDIEDYLTEYVASYPTPHTTLFPVDVGQDGGASAFGDVCVASGGKGGAPGRVWDGTKFIRKGDGGDGGLGGQLTAGGGGKGSALVGVNGGDGIWRPETGIGGGGGGGKSSGEPSVWRPSPGSVAPRALTHTAGQVLVPNDSGYVQPLPSAGGQGSYSYADTSVYGPRQGRQAWVYIRPDGVTITTTSLIVPGGGGGARPMKNLKYGSRAPGFSPNGVVVLRLVKINA